MRAKEFLERDHAVQNLIDWLILLALPLLLWTISDLWMFFPVNAWFDPWFYLGISLNYDLLSSTYPKTYFVTRLPSIIPDLVAHKLFSPYWAVVTTSFLKFYLCIVPIYWTLIEITKNRLATLIPVFILSFYPYFLSSIGWHYVDGYGMGYIALTTAFLTAACTHKNWKVWLFLAGFSQSLMIFNYLFVVTFAVVQLVAFITLNRVNHKRDLFQSALFFGLGGVFCIGLLGLFSYLQNGSFWFFLPQIKAALHLGGGVQLFSGKQSIWYVQFKDWLPNSTWLFVPTFVFITGLGYLFSSFKKENFTKVLFVSQFVLMALIYILLEIAGFNFLQFFYFVSYLLPFSILALGVILSERNIPQKYQTPFILGILILLIVSFSLTGTGAYIGMPWNSRLILFFFGVIVASLFFLRPHKSVYSYLAFSIILLLLQLAFKALASSPGNYTHKDHKDYKLLIDMARLIRKEVPARGHYRFWYDVGHDKLGSFFQPLAGTYINSGGPTGSFSNEFPAISKDSLESGLHNTLIILSSDPDAISKADQALKEKGYKRKDLYQNHFDLEGQKFLMLAFLLESLDNK